MASRRLRPQEVLVDALACLRRGVKACKERRSGGLEWIGPQEGRLPEGA